MAPNNINKEELVLLHTFPLWKQLGRLSIILISFFILAFLGTYFSTWVAWIIIWWFQGFLLACCLIAAHDCGHNSFAKSRRLCRVLGTILSTPLLVNFSAYRYLHFEHHKLTNVDGDTQRPREYKNILSYFFSIFHLKFLYRFIELSVKSLCNQFHSCVRNRKAKKEIQIDSIFLLTFIILIVAAICFYPILIFKYYLMPIIFYLMMVFFFTMAEHSGCEKTSNQQLNARSMHSNQFFRFFFWNFNYHAEHHVYPNIPSSNLEKLHKLIGDSFKYHHKSYILLHLSFIKNIINNQSVSIDN